jgi:hypothetical protein
MEDIIIFWLWVLRTLKCCVAEPMLVNTVSNNTESVENSSFADEDKSAESFLQEKPLNSAAAIKINNMDLLMKSKIQR